MEYLKRSAQAGTTTTRRDQSVGVFDEHSEGGKKVDYFVTAPRSVHELIMRSVAVGF
jgi:hypothetical protein